MFPPKGPNPYGQQPPYGGQQSYGGQLPGSSGFGASAAAGARAGQGAVGQYGGPYASVYGTQQVGGLGGKGLDSSSLPRLPPHPTSLSQSSKFSSGSAGSNLARPNDDYMAVRGYAQKLDQYGTDYPPERRMYGEHSANLGRRDGLTDLDRRYPDHIPAAHQIHDRVEQGSTMRHQPLLKAQLQPVSDMRQADYFAGRSAPIHQESQEIGTYGRAEADHRNLSILGNVPYGGQQTSSLLGGAPRTNIDSLGYGQGSSNSGYGMLPPGRDYASGKGLLHPSSDSDYRDNILPRARPGISMVDERAIDRGGYRRELDLRDEERRRDLLLEREKELERERERELQDLRGRERERDRERERERERERDRERLRDRERERERERQREHERERLRERREKERERNKKHVADSRRERTPPRTPGDHRRSSSVIRSEKSLRRLSPRRDAVHRHRSPIKEIKREYMCKVLPFRFVDDERDCLSLTKRYPRLSVIPDFSKIVLHWAKESLTLSLHTPVSLEHAICEDEDKADESALVFSENTSSAKTPEIIWNAKVLLMSGMSNGAFADITSMRSTEERVVHLNNILKFAVFKKDRSLLAIGGPWNAALDGGDPLVDCSCLIRTAMRYVKELVQVDLSNCTNWNRFLEVHYNRVGNDGLFSHKEITVLFVPNLSECVPSVDIWKNNWIAYRKSKLEREQLIMKTEKSPGDPNDQKQVLEEPSKAKSTNDHLKGGDGAAKIEKIDADMEQQGKDGDVNLVSDDGKNLDNVGDQVEKTVAVVEGNTSEKTVGVVEGNTSEKTVGVVEGKNTSEKIVGVVEANTSGDASVDPVTEDKKPMKKKIIKKVVKVVRKKPTAEAPVDKPPQVEKNAVAESASKTVEKHIEQKSEDLGKEQAAGAGIGQQPEAKKTGKKKVIRRVVKRKVPASVSEPTALAAPAETSKQDIDVQPEKIDEGLTDAGNSQARLEERLKTPAEDTSNQKKEEGLKTPTEDTSDQKKKQELEIKGDIIMTDGQQANIEKVNQQEVVEQKDEKNGKNDKKKEDVEKKDKDQRMDSKKKSPIDTKEKKKSDEPPKHPGFILQAKKSKEYKLRSTSLSLDGLLDYTANDTEESVFELSLFAESFSEMLQYRMGCVILSFLEKLFRQYVVKRNQRKRQREEDLKKEDTKSLEKRLKTTDENLTVSTSGNPGKNDEITKEGGEKMSTDDSSASHEQLIKEGNEKMSTDHPEAAQDEMIKEGEEKIVTDQSAAAHDEPEADEKMEDEDPDYEEDPDEVEYEGDEDMDDVTAEEPAEAQNEDNSNERETKPEEVTAEDDGNMTKENLKLEKVAEEGKQSVAEKGDLKEVGEKSVGREGMTSGSQKGDSVKHDVVDKDLLQAFRYFDQNRVGYIKVDDLRCILHNLGKFLSNRDVKDMVQIALAESNSARDGRIIYTKLVKKADL